ncbi:MAG: 5-oxoprolinase subunit PxpB [Thermoanaerobaculaceae bacterium]|jgi:KipI family sensor histidine kinase inhibitor|nr:5-oxoprolinase subunit PxpB [Thermoanaerobaculaceae bacterium]
MPGPPARPSSDHSLRLELGTSLDRATHERVRRAFLTLREAALPGVTNLHPAYATLLVSFDPRQTTAGPLAAGIETALHRAADAPLPPGRKVDIPVCYGGEAGPDLAEVAAHCGLTLAEVVRRHSGTDYLVHFLGFSPGFPYLGGLPPELGTPRLDTPRPRVPAGSVAIGGAQTGVYPHATPGGWRLIGRTPLRLFDGHRRPPAWLELGDHVHFVPVDTIHQVPADPTSPPVLSGDAVIEVLRPGLLTTVQDLGRPGLAHLGVATGGAADAVSLRIGNLLVGNSEAAAGLEMTLVGSTLRFLTPAVVALAGASMAARLDGQTLLTWQPVVVQAGQVLEIGPTRQGARAYLAFRGGIKVPPVLGSAATHLAAGFGGLAGRALRAGETLAGGQAMPQTRRWRGAADPASTRALLAGDVIRITPGVHARVFPEEAFDALTTASWDVNPRSDRTGVRLRGPGLAPGTATLLTEGVPTGAIQVPPDGQPIAMLADHPTTGGYPQLACVIAADLHRLGQLAPGQTVRFALVTEGDAAAALAALDRHVATLGGAGPQGSDVAVLRGGAHE